MITLTRTIECGGKTERGTENASGWTSTETLGWLEYCNNLILLYSII